jgi:16S rRNA processing protein RimM
MNILPPQVIHLGKITSKHGYKGSVNIFWDDEDLIPEEGDYLFVIINEKGVPFLIESMNTTGEIVKLKNIDTEEQAHDLIGSLVGLDEADVEFQNSPIQLIGFQVINNQQNIGVITEIQNYPGQLMFTVSCENRNFLMPFVEEWIVNIDENSRTLSVDLPDGIIDPDNYEN